MAGISNSPEQPSSLEMSLLWQQMELNNKYQSEPSTEGDAQAGPRLLRQACDTFLRSYLIGLPQTKNIGPCEGPLLQIPDGVTGTCTLNMSLHTSEGCASYWHRQRHN